MLHFSHSARVSDIAHQSSSTDLSAKKEDDQKWSHDRCHENLTQGGTSPPILRVTSSPRSTQSSCRQQCQARHTSLGLGPRLSPYVVVVSKPSHCLSKGHRRSAAETGKATSSRPLRGASCGVGQLRGGGCRGRGNWPKGFEGREVRDMRSRQRR